MDGLDGILFICYDFIDDFFPSFQIFILGIPDMCVAPFNGRVFFDQFVWFKVADSLDQVFLC